MRVIGSQAISTRSLSCSLVVAGRGSVDGHAGPSREGAERGTRRAARAGRRTRSSAGRHQVRVAPVSSCRLGRRHFGSLSSVLRRLAAQRADGRGRTGRSIAVESLPPGGSSMNGMNLSGKPGIVQPMQMPADVGAAADAVDPAPLGHVALHDRAPAAQLDDALRRAVLGGEVALLVVAGAVAALVHGPAEQPGRPQRLVERDHRRLAGRLVEQVGDRLGRGCRAAPGSRARRRSAARPCCSSPSRGSRARPSRRSGCRPSRGCRRRSRRCRPRGRPAPWAPAGRATRSW